MNYYPNQQEPKFDQKQFEQVASTLDKQSLRMLVEQARKQGISDKDIEEGLNIILKHR